MRRSVMIHTVFCLSMSLVFAGCMPRESDEPLAETAQALRPGSGVKLCESGWPGSRPCYATFGDGREILPDSIDWYVDGGDHSEAPAVVQLTDDHRAIRFSASIHEANAFGPHDNNTRYVVEWIYK
jgi:hypothetical protein